MSLPAVFQSYTQGKGDMDSRTLVKLCKETGIIDKQTTPTDIDLIFTKCKAKGAKRITYEDFEKVVEEIAKRKKTSLEEVTEKMCSSSGPSFTGTKMEPVRFYDDKSTFTGVHAHGGPSTLDKPSTKFNGTFGEMGTLGPSGATAQITLADMCDRSTPDVRGVNKNFQKS
ncbi:p25-alpha family protein [Besnoitia besnoiti]|uniref:p25-alpha family protein n=1 Tax=Besnoitia besnoiti TaxID=94643 RepID=A0A2A9MBV4_BESBE|nr:p25-alpha family protein [Besnoitia besnoiti]PFH33097.1 p25-alpha family protein [Besnoitia besnoiti]